MKEIKGDLIKLARDGDFDVIAHGCNCHHRMRSGIAKTIVDLYPEVFKADVENTIKSDKGKLGTTTSTPVDGGKFTIYNCYTQYNYGRDGKMYCDYDAIRSCMNELAESITPDLRIGLPLIGAGLAGGDWSIIKEIIKEELYGCDVTIVHFDK